MKSNPEKVANRRARLRQFFAGKTIPEKDKSLISQIFSGRSSVGEKLAERLEREYDMGPGYLDMPADEASMVREDHGTYQVGNIATPPRPISVYDQGDPVLDDEVEVPVLNMKLSAGSGRIQFDIDDTGRRHRYDRRWIDRLGIRDPKKLTTVRIDGDSMRPDIPDGASVVLYLGNLPFRSGEIYAIDYQGEFFIKRLYKDPDGSMRIVSDNPNKSRYPDIVVQPEYAESLRVLGLVVEVKKQIISRLWG